MYAKCVENSVCKYKDEYVCYLCKFSANDSTSMLEHIRSDVSHKKRIRDTAIGDTINELQLNEPMSMEIFLNGVVSYEKKFRCIICCKRNLKNLTEISQHIVGKEHKDRLENLMRVEPIVFTYKCQMCSTFFKSNNEFKYHSMFHVGLRRYPYSSYIDVINFVLREDKAKFIYCSLCNIVLMNEEELEYHIKSATHCKWINLLKCTEKFTLDDGAAKQWTICEIDDKKNDIAKSFYCCICESDKLSIPRSLTEHKISSAHMKKMPLIKNHEKINLISISNDCAVVFICFICNIEFLDKKCLHTHYKDSKHQFRVNIIHELSSKKYITFSDTDINKLHCSICNSSFNSLEKVYNHIKYKHLTYTIESLSNSEKSILLLYKCAICDLDLKSDAELKYHTMFHLNPERHTNPDIDIVNFSLQEDKTKFIHCSPCDIVLFNEEELSEHIKSKDHYKWIHLLNQTEKFALDDYRSKTLLKINKDMIYNTKSQEIVFASKLFCNICELDMQNKAEVLREHKISKTHRTKMSLTKENEKSELTPVNKDYSSAYICFICNIKFSLENRLLFHYNDEFHKFRVNVLHELSSKKYINFSVENMKSQKIQCTLCNVEVIGIRVIFDHMFGSKHKKIYLQKGLPLESFSRSKNENENEFACYVCETNVSDFMLYQHLSCEKHKKSAKKSGQIKLFSCQKCEKFFSSDLQLIEHFRDNKHDSHETKASEIVDVATEDQSRRLDDSHGADKARSISVEHETKTDVETPVAGASASPAGPTAKQEVGEEKEETPAPAKREIKLRRPRRIFNLSEIGENYVELCLEPGGRNIYNIDANTMYKLRLGIALSFPTEAERRYCIPCNKEMPSDLEILNNHLHDEDHERRIVEMVAKDKPHGTDNGDYLNDFRLACSYMERSPTTGLLLCFACLARIEDPETCGHVQSKAHLDNCRPLELSSELIFANLNKAWQNNWYFAEKFVCDVCCVRHDSEIHFAEHLIQEQHVQLASSRDGEPLRSYVCVYCATYWCSRDNLYASHCNDQQHRRMLETRDYVIPALADPVKHILRHYESTIGFLAHDSDEIDREAEASLLKLLETIVRKRYPAVKAHLFGSRLSRTQSERVDVDVYLDCDDAYRELESAEKIRERLAEILKCFGESEEKSWTIEGVTSTTSGVLSIGLENRYLNLRFNVQCGNGLVVEKSKLVRLFVEACPDCRSLIVFLKKWAVLCRLSGTIFTDHAISTLVIFYLQREGILPSLVDLAEKTNESNIVAGWETGFLVNQTTSPKKTYAVKDHLSRFFNFYAEFNYVTNVICPFLGRALPKRDFVSVDNLPNEMNVYKSLYKRGHAKVFRFDSPMCVQDSIELSENVTEAVTKTHLRRFRQYCLESRKILDKNQI